MMKSSFLPALLALILFGCAPKASETLYYDIHRITAHGEGKYTFYIRRGVSDSFEVVYVNFGPRSVEVYEDRKHARTKWAVVHAESRAGCVMRVRLEIHVHDLSDIE